MGHKGIQIACFERAQHLKEKSRAKNYFALVNRAVAKFIYAKNISGFSGTLKSLLLHRKKGMFQNEKLHLRGVQSVHKPLCLLIDMKIGVVLVASCDRSRNDR